MLRTQLGAQFECATIFSRGGGGGRLISTQNECSAGFKHPAKTRKEKKDFNDQFWKELWKDFKIFVINLLAWQLSFFNFFFQ